MFYVHTELTQIGWFTADNASNNFPAINEVASQLGPGAADWNPKQRYIR